MPSYRDQQSRAGLSAPERARGATKRECPRRDDGSTNPLSRRATSHLRPNVRRRRTDGRRREGDQWLPGVRRTGDHKRSRDRLCRVWPGRQASTDRPRPGVAGRERTRACAAPEPSRDGGHAPPRVGARSRQSVRVCETGATLPSEPLGVSFRTLRASGGPRGPLRRGPRGPRSRGRRR